MRPMELPPRTENKTADVKRLSLLKLNFNDIYSSQLRGGNSQWKTTIDSVRITVVNKEGEAGQMNAKLPKLIRCIPSMILWWLNHLWLNKPYPGGDHPSVAQVPGKDAPQPLTQKSPTGSHTVGRRTRVSPTGPSGTPGGNSFVREFARASAQPLSHSSI